MFLIVEKLQDGTDLVHLGPMNWRPSFFKSCLRDDLEIDFSVPLSNDSYDCIVVSDTVKIIPIREAYTVGDYNSKIHQLVGPYYNFYTDYAEMYHNVENKPVEVVKSELKQVIAANRYKYEIMGITVTIQNTPISVLTSRGDRDLYLQAYQMGKDGISWKFEDQFLTVSNAELGQIVVAVTDHVQAAFDWEYSKQNEIDSKTTVAELDTVSLVSDNPIWQPPPPTPPTPLRGNP